MPCAFIKVLMTPPPPGVGDDEFRLAVFRRAPDEIRQWIKGFIKAPGK